MAVSRVGEFSNLTLAERRSLPDAHGIFRQPATGQTMNVGSRRYLVSAAHSGQGLLTEPPAVTQVGRRELVILPEAV
jgi:hypothetical protein